MEQPTINSVFYHLKPNHRGRLYGYGITYQDGREWTTGFARRANEAQELAQALAQEHGTVAEQWTPERKAALRAERLQQMASEPLEFVGRDELCAVPTLGGILSDLGLEKLRERFPDSVILPVSRLLAAAHNSDKEDPPAFVVVSWEGRGVALTPDEAEARSLQEAPNWVPDLSGVPSVPEMKDF
ncbi:MAG: hypothetical protein LAT63_17430 [Marinobacter sp.]|nr:hypothetical protein [Marinobacter sp.]